VPDVERKSSPVVLATMGRYVIGERRLAFVADTDAGSVAVFDTELAKLLGMTPVSGSPSHLLLTTSDGNGRLYVTARDANVVRVMARRTTSAARQAMTTPHRSRRLPSISSRVSLGGCS
jgi:hypothetical protein